MAETVHATLMVYGFYNALEYFGDTANFVERKNCLENSFRTVFGAEEGTRPLHGLHLR